jgi:putative DNA-invertase from lambdoid prophage Rac
MDRMTHSPQSRKAAIYLRVSTEDQSLDNQRPDVDRLASARGLDVVARYEEHASAAKARPAFAKMMDDARRGRFDTLVIWALDRFGRSMVKNLEDVRALDGYRVRVISVCESWLDTDGPSRDLLIAVFGWIAEQERKRLVERTRAGMARAKANGVHVGRPRAALNVAVARELLPGRTLGEVALMLRVSVSTLRRALRSS